MLRGIEVKKVIIVGAGGHAKVIVDMLQKNGEFEVVGFIDRAGAEGFWNIPVLGTDETVGRVCREMAIKYVFVALGSGKLREKVTEKVLAEGLQLINVVSSYAIVSDRARLGKGVAVMPGAVINADVEIGDGCIINTNASVDHDGKIGDYTHIAPGSTVSGYVSIGRQCLLGTGCRVIDRITIGDDTIVGSGAAVIRNIESGSVAVGVPAKSIRRSG